MIQPLLRLCMKGDTCSQQRCSVARQAQSRAELMNIGWAVAWGWLPMTLAGLVVKTIASAALNEMATDQIGKEIAKASAGSKQRIASYTDLLCLHTLHVPFVQLHYSTFALRCLARTHESTELSLCSVTRCP